LSGITNYLQKVPALSASGHIRASYAWSSGNASLVFFFKTKQKRRLVNNYQPSRENVVGRIKPELEWRFSDDGG
jgi:hypothetical protein